MNIKVGNEAGDKASLLDRLKMNLHHAERQVVNK